MRGSALPAVATPSVITAVSLGITGRIASRAGARIAIRYESRESTRRASSAIMYAPYLAPHDQRKLRLPRFRLRPPRLARTLRLLRPHLDQEPRHRLSPEPRLSRKPRAYGDGGAAPATSWPPPRRRRPPRSPPGSPTPACAPRRRGASSRR